MSAIRIIRKHQSQIASRAIWLVMFLGHIPALIAVAARLADAPQFADGFRLLLLAASQVFFLFKIIDVAWLRFPTSRSFWIRFIVIVALLHAGAVWDADWSAADRAIAFALDLTPSLVLATILLRAFLRHTQAKNIIPHLHARRALRKLRDGWQMFHDAVSPRPQMAYRMVAPDRAPPTHPRG